jgi:hypothetical protein
VPDQLHGPVDLLQEVDPVTVAEALERHLEDGKGHLREVEE